MQSCMSVKRAAVLWVAGASVAVLTCLILAEVILRILWTNPYDYSVVGREYQEPVFFQQPQQRSVYDIEGLYEGAKSSLFRTGALGQVLGREEPNYPAAYFLGGSTTEARYVTEGVRWPELVEGVHAVNFGYSGRSLMDIYFNLGYLLSNDPKPSEIFIMEAVNDFSKRDNFGEIQWRKTYRAEASNQPQEISAVARGVYIIGFFKSLFAKRSGDVDRSVLNTYIREVSEKQRQTLIEHVAFLSVFGEQSVEWQGFLKNRAAIIRRIVDIASTHCVRVTFITQPNAYRDNYTPYQGRDLRVYPDYREKNLSVAQARNVFEQINENTRVFARRFGASVVDASEEFERFNPSDLFYDAVHYSEKGSILLAAIVSRHLKERANERYSCKTARDISQTLDALELMLLRGERENIFSKGVANAKNPRNYLRLIAIAPEILVDNLDALAPNFDVVVRWGGVIFLNRDARGRTVAGLGDVPKDICQMITNRLRRGGRAPRWAEPSLSFELKDGRACQDTNKINFWLS